MRGINYSNIAIACKIKKVLSRAHMCSMEERARNAHDQNEQTLHIFTLLPQFRITVFISKFVQLHGVLSFQNKHICLAIYGPQCESLLISHLQVRMNEAEMLYFHSKAAGCSKRNQL